MLFSGPKSYYDEYVRKTGSQRILADPPSLLTDRGAYVNFLEVQLERVSAACLSIQAYDGRFDDMQNLIVALDQKYNNTTKLVTLLQQFMEEMNKDSIDRYEKLSTDTKEFSKSSNSLIQELTNRINIVEKTNDNVSSRLVQIENQSVLQEKKMEGALNSLEDDHKKSNSLIQDLSIKIENLGSLIENCNTKLSKKSFEFDEFKLKQSNQLVILDKKVEDSLLKEREILTGKIQELNSRMNSDQSSIQMMVTKQHNNLTAEIKNYHNKIEEKIQKDHFNNNEDLFNYFSEEINSLSENISYELSKLKQESQVAKFESESNPKIRKLEMDINDDKLTDNNNNNNNMSLENNQEKKIVSDIGKEDIKKDLISSIIKDTVSAVSEVNKEFFLSLIEKGIISKPVLQATATDQEELAFPSSSSFSIPPPQDTRLWSPAPIRKGQGQSSPDKKSSQVFAESNVAAAKVENEEFSKPQEDEAELIAQGKLQPLPSQSPKQSSVTSPNKPFPLINESVSHNSKKYSPVNNSSKQVENHPEIHLSSQTTSVAKPNNGTDSFLSGTNIIMETLQENIHEEFSKFMGVYLNQQNNLNEKLEMILNQSVEKAQSQFVPSQVSMPTDEDCEDNTDGYFEDKPGPPLEVQESQGNQGYEAATNSLFMRPNSRDYQPLSSSSSASSVASSSSSALSRTLDEFFPLQAKLRRRSVSPLINSRNKSKTEQDSIQYEKEDFDSKHSEDLNLYRNLASSFPSSSGGTVGSLVSDEYPNNTLEGTSRTPYVSLRARKRATRMYESLNQNPWLPIRSVKHNISSAPIVTKPLSELPFKSRPRPNQLSRSAETEKALLQSRGLITAYPRVKPSHYTGNNANKMSILNSPSRISPSSPFDDSISLQTSNNSYDSSTSTTTSEKSREDIFASIRNVRAVNLNGVKDKEIKLVGSAAIVKSYKKEPN